MGITHEGRRRKKEVKKVNMADELSITRMNMEHLNLLKAP
jgi:hypothetical protein